MTSYGEATPLGAARVTIFNAGEIVERMELQVPEDERFPGYQATYEAPARSPFLAVHITLEGGAILVDCCDYAASLVAYEFTPPPGEPAPPDIPAQLRACGIAPEAVSHLVITHAHLDHYNGVTVARAGRREPAFPNARCFAGRADWESDEGRRLLREEAADSMGELFRRGMVTLVDGARELVPGVRLIPAPGESPGHLLLRLESGGRVLYCVGDLFHHPAEVEHPTWMPTWADAEPLLASRRALIAAALAEDAQLVAAHIPGVGRLQRTSTGVLWQEA